VMSTMAAAMRIGFFAGPFLGGAVVLAVGPRGGFAVELVAVVVAVLLMVRVPDLAAPPSETGTRLVTVVREHVGLLSTLGNGVALMGLARSARTAIIPLWAEQIGLDAAGASLVWGLANTVDVAVSYPAGALMDRFGRRAVSVPAMAVLAAGFVALPWATTPAAFVGVAVVLGLGNGMTNGAVMTLGADVAPPSTRAEFLSAWRLMHDGGAFAGPLLVGLVAAVAPLGVAAVALGAATGAGGWSLWRFVPRYVHRPTGRCPVPTDNPTDLPRSTNGTSRP
jgi:hypothetical protein